MKVVLENLLTKKMMALYDFLFEVPSCGCIMGTSPFRCSAFEKRGYWKIKKIIATQHCHGNEVLYCILIFVWRTLNCSCTFYASKMSFFFSSNGMKIFFIPCGFRSIYWVCLCSTNAYHSSMITFLLGSLLFYKV